MTRHRPLYLLLLAFLLIPTTPLAAQTSRPITSEHSFGCRSEEYLDELVGYAAEKDLEAFRKGLSTGLLLGECTLFKKGEEVLVIDTKIFAEPKHFAGLAKVRREGEVEEYWIDIAAVKRPEAEPTHSVAGPESVPGESWWVNRGVVRVGEGPPRLAGRVERSAIHSVKRARRRPRRRSSRRPFRNPCMRLPIPREPGRVTFVVLSGSSSVLRRELDAAQPTRQTNRPHSPSRLRRPLRAGR